jgi:hypothetical protein
VSPQLRRPSPAAGINDAILAAAHPVETMLARYTHAVGESSAQVRRVIS